MKDLVLIDEMTPEELSQIEKEIEAGTCKTGISAEQMYYQLVGQGVLKMKRTLLTEEDFLNEINANTEVIMEFVEKNDKAIREEREQQFEDCLKQRNIYNDINANTKERWVINLHKHMTRWAVYRPGVVPVNGNQCGYLAPSQYGGLSYHCYNKSYSYADVFHIPTSSYGEVQIWVPADNDACRKSYVSFSAFTVHHCIEGNKLSQYSEWGGYGCNYKYQKTSPTHKTK